MFGRSNSVREEYGLSGKKNQWLRNFFHPSCWWIK